ncbi:MAG TPA: TraB/GumN family protein [Steroidobacteraceae bacterium]
MSYWINIQWPVLSVRRSSMGSACVVSSQRARVEGFEQILWRAVSFASLGWRLVAHVGGHSDMGLHIGMRPTQLLVFIALLRASTLLAGEAPRPAVRPRLPSEKALQEVLVTADHAGPALWKVTSGQHLLWILAAPPTPLPTRFVWRSKQVESAIASAQELILDGGITFNSRRSDMRMTAAAYADMRTLPGPFTSLAEVIPEDLYRRFKLLQDAFAADYDSMQQLRPWAAGFELNRHVMKSLQLSDTVVSDSLLRLGWRAKVITLYTYADYARFERNSKSSRTVSCLEEIVSELEADRDDLRRLEHAWSVGDTDAMREVALRQHPDTCVIDMFDSDAQARDAIAHHAAQWLDTVDAALKTRETTFALVPADELFAPDGWLAALRARGYDIQEPQ